LIVQPVHVVLHWAAREGLVSECTVRESGRAALFIATPTTTGEIVSNRCVEDATSNRPRSV